MEISFEEETINSARKVDMRKRALLVIDIFERAEVVIPSGFWDALDVLVGVMGVLKVKPSRSRL
jgi:hypothetical protein